MQSWTKRPKQAIEKARSRRGKSADRRRKDQGASPYEPQARHCKNREIFKTRKNPKAGLKWVPKKVVNCVEGTAVPEAKEVDTEADFKFGPHNVLDPASCEALRG